MKARCPHGWRWFRCDECSIGVKLEVPKGWQRVETESGNVGFFSADHRLNETTIFDTITLGEPLTHQTFLRARTDAMTRAFGRHLRVVK